MENMKIPRWGTKAAGIVVLTLVFSYACGGMKPGVSMIKYQFDEMLIQHLGTLYLQVNCQEKMLQNNGCLRVRWGGFRSLGMLPNKENISR